MRITFALLLAMMISGVLCDAYAAPQITRILRKNNKLEGRDYAYRREREPTYRAPKYYPDNYPEYGKERTSTDAGWQQVPDNDCVYYPTRSHGPKGAGTRSGKKRRY